MSESVEGVVENCPMNVPKTITPWNVRIGIWLLATVFWVVVSLILVPLMGLWGPVLGLAFTLVLFGWAIAQGWIMGETPDFKAIILFNPFAKSRRVLFPGLNFRLLWESPEENRGPVDLRRLVKAEIDKTRPTNDPAEVMRTKILIHLRVNAFDVSPEEAAQNVVRFISIEEDSLVNLISAEVEKMFSQHYAGEEMENLLQTSEVQDQVLKNGAATIKMLEDKYGIKIGIALEVSQPTEATQEMKRTPARAEALRTSIETLMKLGEDGKEGLSLDQARRASLILDSTNDYKEEVWHLEVTGLENLQHANVVVPGAIKKGENKK